MRFRINLLIVATSNNMVDQYSECFLQFKITTFDRNKTEDVLHMELNVSQFYELFSEIEKIKNLIDFYKK